MIKENFKNKIHWLKIDIGLSVWFIVKYVLVLVVCWKKQKH